MLCAAHKADRLESTHARRIFWSVLVGVLRGGREGGNISLGQGEWKGSIGRAIMLTDANVWDTGTLCVH